MKPLLILLQHSVFLGRFLLAWHILTWKYLPTLLYKTLQICQVARAQHSTLQITPQIYNWIQVWALIGPFQNFHLLLVNPFFCWFGFILWVAVVLKDEVPNHLQISSSGLKGLCQHWMVFGTIYKTFRLV